MAETVAPNDYRLLFSAFPNVFPSLTYQYLGFTPDLNDTRAPDHTQRPGVTRLC